MTILNKTVIGAMAGLTLLGAAAGTPASARDGGAIAAGAIGGLALGAIAGSAIANGNRGYYDGGGYAPAYAAPQPYYGGGCYFTRQPVYDEYGELAGHRRVRVCE